MTVNGPASFKDAPNGQATFSQNSIHYDEPNYFIMDTDYDSYAMVYACVPDAPAKLYIMSREQTMDDATFNSLLSQAKDKLPHYNFNKTMKVKQGGDCTYGNKNDAFTDDLYFLY